MKTYLKSTHLLILIAFISLVVSIQKNIISFKHSESAVQFEANFVNDLTLLKAKIHSLHEHKNNAHIQSFNISITFCDLPMQILEIIFPENLKFYEKVYINTWYCQIEKEGIKYLLSKIHPKTQQIWLNFNSISSKGDIALTLAEELSKLTPRRLTLLLQTNQIKDEGLDQFLLNHILHNALEHLSLDLTHNHITEKGLVRINQYMTKSSKEVLKSFQLNLFSNKIKSEGLQLLSQSFENFDFQNLTLDLYMNDIKGKAIANLAQKLLNMKKLRHLKVCLSSNFIETQGGTELAKALIQMNNLLSLDLKVNRAFGYNGFAPIVEAIGKLSNLKSLVFHAGINKVGIKGAQKMAETLSNLSNLNYLDLNFAQNQIIDKGIKVISKAIDQLPNLSDLKLHLSFNNGQTDGIIQVLQFISKKNISRLIINFSGNKYDDIRIQSILGFLKQISRKCESFEFELQQNPISKEMTKKLENALQSNRCATKIYLNYQNQGIDIQNQLEKKNSEL